MTGHIQRDSHLLTPAAMRKHRASRIRAMFIAMSAILREQGVTITELARASNGELDVQSCYRILSGKSLPRVDLFEAFVDAVSIVIGDATITVEHACSITGLAKVELRDFVTGFNLTHPDKPIRYIRSRVNYRDLMRAINRTRRVKTERMNKAPKQELGMETSQALSLLLMKGGLADT